MEDFKEIEKYVNDYLTALQLLALIMQKHGKEIIVAMCTDESFYNIVNKVNALQRSDLNYANELRVKFGFSDLNDD